MGGYRVRCPALVIALLLVPLLVAGQEASPGESKENGDVSKEQVQEEPQPVIAEEVKDKSNKDYVSKQEMQLSSNNSHNENQTNTFYRIERQEHTRAYKPSNDSIVSLILSPKNKTNETDSFMESKFDKSIVIKRDDTSKINIPQSVVNSENNDSESNNKDDININKWLYTENMLKDRQYKDNDSNIEAKQSNQKSNEISFTPYLHTSQTEANIEGSPNNDIPKQISPDDSVSNIENISHEIKSEHENTEKQNKKAKDIFYLKKNSYNPQDADYKDSVALVNKVLEMKGKQNKKKHEEIDFQTLANFVHGNLEDIHQSYKESEEEMAAIETAVSNVEEDKKDIGKSVTEELTVKLMEHFKAFEVLALPPLHLACVTSTERDYFPQKQDKGFDTRLGHLSPQYEILQKYVAGANKEGVTMPLKRPFLMSVTPQMNSTVVRASCAWLSTFSNLIPSQMDRHLGFLDIPQPIDERVEIYATGQTIKFCRTFTGFANDWIYRREAKKLMDAILEAGLGEKADFSSYCITISTGNDGKDRHSVAFMQKEGGK